MRSLRDIYQLRTSLTDAVRNFFLNRTFIEIQTPTLVQTPGTEIHLDYFSTHWNDAFNKPHSVFLRSSPELHMKQALAEGLSKIFQLGPCYRNNGELGPWHHPEFTMLEWYDTECGFSDFIQQTIDLLRFTHEQMKSTHGSLIPYTFPNAVPEFTLKQLFHEVCQLDLVDQDADLAKKGRLAGVHSLMGDEDFETAFFKILIEKIEPHLQQFPICIVKHYPASQAALARIQGDVAERFEVFINGIELSNAFHELTDASEHHSRFKDMTSQRIALKKQEINIDDDFLKVIDKGFPACCGNALGFDRWLALLLGDNGIGDVIPFRIQNPYRRGIHGKI